MRPLLIPLVDVIDSTDLGLHVVPIGFRVDELIFDPVDFGIADIYPSADADVINIARLIPPLNGAIRKAEFGCRLFLRE